MKQLSGWKTNIGMVVLGLVSIAGLLKWIPMDSVYWAWATIGPLTGIAARQGMKKSAPKGEQ